MASLASFASARGYIASSAASVTGSDPGATAPPHRPTPMPSVKPMQSEASASAAPITTSSSAVSLHAGGHQYLSPNLQAPADAPKRNPRHRTEQQRTQQANRSRSRARRRFSGSYATSSHSPASDRGPMQKEKEEGKSPPVRAYPHVPVAVERPLTPHSEAGAVWCHWRVCARLQGEE